MQNWIKRSLVIGATSLALAGCMDGASTGTTTASMSTSDTMMSRAETLAARGSVTSAQLTEAFETGVQTQAVQDTEAGTNFANSCNRLKSTTDNSAGLNALGADASLTFARCAGFFS
ncbi:hypothetical protein [Cognatishimia sp. MH4019]|uniref:hypothetical protein n=1 Tax=Cognatishimia sp. MH4019 TaxID=2854030 RepID=UPI001CD39A52|nr:hypothetical protein [Cognatishimia sp. MH4019]